MTLDLTLLENVDIPVDIVLGANTQVEEHTKTTFRTFLQNLEKPLTHPVLKSLPSVVGLPCNTFLCRLAAISEYNTGSRKVNTVSVINENLTILADPEAQGPSKAVDPVKQISALRQLSELVNADGCVKDFEEWAMHNSTELHSALISCLNSENPLIVEEAAVTISFLARKLHFALLNSAETLIGAMVAVLAVALNPTENHVESYRKAVEFHKECSMTKPIQMPFRYPRQNYEFSEPKFRVIGYLYYALTDFLCNVPHPFLIHYFQCRILRRKEVTRTHLFRIFSAIVKHLIDLEEFAMDICPKLEKRHEKLGAHISPVKITIKNLINPIHQPEPVETKDTETTEDGGFKPEFYQKDQWSNLPSKLYSEMLRKTDERNPENLNLISNFMAELKSISTIRLPSVDLAGENIGTKLMESVNRRIRIDIPRSPEGAHNVENDKVTSGQENGKVKVREGKDISANNSQRVESESQNFNNSVRGSDVSFNSDTFRSDWVFI